MEMNEKPPILVTIFLRGGMDGLNFVFPISGPDRAIYEAERPGIKLSNQGEDAKFKLNDEFAIHPKAAELHKLYTDKKLAVIHAAGVTLDTRSHFDAQNLIERGAPSMMKVPESGWITRYLNSAKIRGKIPVVSLSNTTPTSIFLFDRASVVDQLNGQHWPVQKELEGEFNSLVRAMYAGEVSERPWIQKWGSKTFDLADELNSLAVESSKEESKYPKGEIGGRLQTLAKLLKRDSEVEVATVDMGGWDTHRYQGDGAAGNFGNLVGQLSQAVSTFYEEVSADRKVIITVQTEFGRRLKENANRGTDHGHGGVMLVLGDQVQGGKMLGHWPGLKTENLYQRADLAVTTDYRQVLAEILSHRLKFARVQEVFAGFDFKKTLGLFSKA